MRSIASALFGVLATVGGVPIIRALPGGPAQMIAEHLSKVQTARILHEATVVDGLTIDIEGLFEGKTKRLYDPLV